MKITAIGNLGRIFLLFCSASLLVFLGWFRFGHQGIDYSRIYRIGYGNDVPLHFKGENGLPTGLAVELVKEAARRKGIKLQWEELRTNDSEPLDLSVLQTIRPERRKTTYFTEPYLESESCFVVLTGSPVQELNDLRTARITFLNYRVHRDNLGRLLPDSLRMPEESSREALSKMAAGLSDAAYIDQYALSTAMLSGGVPAPIRIVGADLPKTQMAIASLPAIAAVADKIREGMRSMGDDGSVATLVERWALFPHLTTDVIRSLATSQRSNRWLAAGLLGLAVGLLATTWLALRLRSQTIRLKQAEEAHQYLSEIVERSRNEIYIFDSTTLKLNHANLGASTNLRYTTEALKDLSPLDLMPEFTDSSFRALIQPLLTKERELLVFQTTLRRADDSRYPVEVHLQLVNTGRQDVFLAVILEITERKKAEAAVKQEQAITKAIVDSIPGAFYVLDENGRYARWNVYQRDEIVGQPEEMVAGLDAAATIHSDDRALIQSRIANVLVSGRDETVEGRVLLRGGPAFRWLLMTGRQMMIEGRPFLVGIGIDITARKQVEEALESSLREKVALLNEVHHRVKNNLQVITSLLRMEARRSEHPTTKIVLDEMKNRILSMALLHDSLYRSGTFASVDLGSYLKQLSNQSFRAQIVRPGSVKLQLNLTSVEVEMDQALPCGLLVNELISNCLKHGFPGDHSGEVRVELQPMIGGSQLRLRVSDTGVGLPADFEAKHSNSLGLQLVSSLARQIDGRLEIGPSPGAVFEVIFTPKHPKPIPSSPTP